MRPDIQLLTETLPGTAEFIVKYGFLGVGLVLIFVIAPAIQRLARAKRVAQGTAIFGVAFVVAYGVISLLNTLLPGWPIKRVMISGVVRHVPNGRIVQMQSNLWRVGQAYSKREFDPQEDNIFNFPFLLVTREPPSCLSVGLESTDKNSDTELFNVTPISADDMAPNIDIVIEVARDQDRSILNVWREINGKQSAKAVRFPALDQLDPPCGAARVGSSDEWSLFSPANAQPAPTSDADIVQRLQSDDVFVRREARIALSRRGDDGLKLIEQLLSRDDNYRLQLGALVALTGMPDGQKQKLTPAARDKIQSLMQKSSDKTMRDTAAQALK